MLICAIVLLFKVKCGFKCGFKCRKTAKGSVKLEGMH